MRPVARIDAALVSRTLFGFVLVLLGWSLVGMAFGVAAPPFWLPLGLLVLLFLFAPLAATLRGEDADDEGGGPGPSVTPVAGGFEWRPANDPTGKIPRRIAHEWLDAERGRRVVSTLTFEVPDGVPAEVVDEATRRGLKRATSALPGRGKVRLRGEVEDVRGPTSLVRVRLDVMGFGADGAWAGAAAEAFAGAFVERLQEKGWAARPRG